MYFEGTHILSIERSCLTAAWLRQRAGYKDSWLWTWFRLFTARPGRVQYQQHILHHLRKACACRNYKRPEKELDPRITDNFCSPLQRNTVFISKRTRRFSCVRAQRSLPHRAEPGESRYLRYKLLHRNVWDSGRSLTEREEEQKCSKDKSAQNPFRLESCEESKPQYLNWQCKGFHKRLLTLITALFWICSLRVSYNIIRKSKHEQQRGTAYSETTSRNRDCLNKIH